MKWILRNTGFAYISDVVSSALIACILLSHLFVRRLMILTLAGNLLNCKILLMMIEFLPDVVERNYVSCLHG